MRTPRTAATGQDSIMAQAQNLARLQNMQTPLLGGANPELNPTDFTGVTPKPSIAATPNPLAALAAQAGATPMPSGVTPGRGGAAAGQGGLFGATPGRGAIAGVAATPLALVGATPGRGAIGVTPGQTPLRDELGLNEGEMRGLTGAKAAKAQQVGVTGGYVVSLGVTGGYVVSLGVTGGYVVSLGVTGGWVVSLGVTGGWVLGWGHRVSSSHRLEVKAYGTPAWVTPTTLGSLGMRLGV
jgi:hypothetical protein